MNFLVRFFNAVLLVFESFLTKKRKKEEESRAFLPLLKVQLEEGATVDSADTRDLLVSTFGTDVAEIIMSRARGLERRDDEAAVRAALEKLLFCACACACHDALEIRDVVYAYAPTYKIIGGSASASKRGCMRRSVPRWLPLMPGNVKIVVSEFRKYPDVSFSLFLALDGIILYPVYVTFASGSSKFNVYVSLAIR